MSGPVPSPSMNGMTGLAGTWSRPSFMAIGWPSAGACGVRGLGAVAGMEPAASFQAVEMTQSRRETTLNLAGSTSPGNRAASEPGGGRAAVAAAAAIHAAHEHWIRGFEEITRRARERFERRDWRAAQADATARLALYRIHLDGAVADVRDILDDAVLERTLWAVVKARHAEGLAGHPEREVAQTFFNSVTRRIFSTVGAGPRHRVPRPAPSGRIRR